MSHQNCPERSELTEFVLGRLDEETLDVLAAHLVVCIHCQAIVLSDSQRHPDSLLRAFSQVAASDDVFTSEPELQTSMEKVIREGLKRI